MRVTSSVCPAFSPQFEQSMIDAIYGSNMIEFAGTSYGITSNICRAIFRGETSSLTASIQKCEPDYETHRQALLNENRRADKDAIVESRMDVINHVNAFNYMIERVIINNEGLSEEAICETHRILAAGFSHGEVTPGEYRTFEVAVRYNEKKSSPCMRSRVVRQRMAQMIADLANDIAVGTASGELDAYTLAARYHQIFVSIHPFGDGNGRVSRIILNVLLLKYAGDICILGMTESDRKDYLMEVTKGCKAFHEEDGEVAHEEQTSHLGVAKHVRNSSATSLGGLGSWLRGTEDNELKR